MTLVYEVLQLEQEIEDKLSYHFLDENIMIDKINKSKLKSLTFVMRQYNFPKHIQDKYIIAITLVEIASEIHEQIKENDEIKDDHQDSLTKQLTVLGGDYYSSLYYMLLAELEDIKFIQHIATTIKRLNELKMDFNFFVSRDPNNYFTLRQKIESYIINSVAQYIEFNDENTLKTIERLLLVDLLHREKDFYETKNTFNYFKQDDIYDYLVEHIDMIIATYKKEIQMLLSTFRSEEHRVGKECNGRSAGGPRDWSSDVCSSDLFNDENTLKTIERLLLVDLLHREKDFYETKNTFNYFKQDDIYDYLVEHIDMIIATYKKEIQMLLSTFNDEDKQSSFLYFNQLMNNDLVYMEEG